MTIYLSLTSLCFNSVVLKPAARQRKKPKGGARGSAASLTTTQRDFGGAASEYETDPGPTMSWVPCVWTPESHGRIPKPDMDRCTWMHWFDTEELSIKLLE